jgi:hypothetical protein
MRVRGTAFVIMVGSIAALGCRAAVDPDPFRTGQVFVLQSIAGVALPAPEAQNAACGSLVVADTLVLYDNGTGLRRTVQDVPSYEGAVNPVTCEPAASSPKRRIARDYEFEYRLNGSAIEVDYPCNDVIIVMASCIAGPHHIGTLTAQGLVFDVSRTSRAPLVYVPRPD